MRWGRALAAAVCGPILLLAACSDDGDPVVLPTGTTSSATTPSETTSATVTPSTEPTPTTTLVLPDEHVPEVDQFVQQFFAAYNAAQDSGDFTAWDAMYLPQCAGCKTMRDELEGWLADGAVVEGADWVILQQSSTPFIDDYQVTAIAYRTGGQVGLGEPIEQLGPQLFNLDVRHASPLIIYDFGSGPAK